MVYKSAIEQELIKDSDTTSDVKDVKTVVFQEMIWPGMVEVRAFCGDGRVFSCLYLNDEKISPFVIVPNKENK